jgi:transposase-like protein
MNKSNSSDDSRKDAGKKRRIMSAEKKFQIYLETQEGNKPVGELLRREGLYSTDLARIRQQVKEGALQRLSAKPGQKQGQVSTEAYQAIKDELEQKERALADLSVELAILRKKTSGGSWDRLPACGSKSKPNWIFSR